MKFSSQVIYKLTLLWAFAESGLGGLLHGFKLPITGFVLGAFSVVIISLMAHFSKKPYSDIIRATLMVLVIKFAVSPHSPLPAYVAVLFQGVLGALTFQFIKHNAWSVVLFSLVVLIESAIQKPLVATLLFGTELWVALDELMNRVFTFFGITGVQHFSLKFLTLYLSIYSIWAVIVAVWAYRLPAQLQKIDIDRSKLERNRQNVLSKKNRSGKIFYSILLLVLLILLAFHLLESTNPWIYVVRTALILFVVYALVVPILKWVLVKFSAKHQPFVQDYMLELPRFQTAVQHAFLLSKSEINYWKRTTAFVRYFIWLNLNDEEHAS